MDFKLFLINHFKNMSTNKFFERKSSINFGRFDINYYEGVKSENILLNFRNRHPDRYNRKITRD